jgi:uncharacterized protein (DUF697 family)
MVTKQVEGIWQNGYQEHIIRAIGIISIIGNILTATWSRGYGMSITQIKETFFADISALCNFVANLSERDCRGQV